jgi:hypothetical protein
MAKSKKLQEQEKLIEVLKFTPRTYQLSISGYGGEAYAGKIDRKIYDYFKEKKIDMDEYASSWDADFSDVPEDLQPFTPGSPYDCEDLFHCSGAELSNSNSIIVYDEHNEEHWSCTADINDLEDEGVDVNESSGCNFDDLPEDTVVFWGGQGEKGVFFDGAIELREPFDPKKLSIAYENCDGWWIISAVEYEGEEIDGSGAYSTTGKWAEHKWILCNGEEPYQGVERGADEDSDDDEEAHETGTDNPIDFPAPDLPITDWYPIDVKPVHKGEYDVDLGKGIAWPFARIVRAEWTGRSWKDSEGKAVKGIEAWRGLAEDPNKLVIFECECVQCDWRGPIDDTNDWDGQMCCPECGEPVELK